MKPKPKKIKKKQEDKKEEEKEISLHDINFSFDLKNTHYELDVLQNRMLEFYLRADPRFLRAFSLNFTQDFIQFIKDKAKLREPIHLSIMGSVRGGKSYSAITIAIIHQACLGKKFSVDFITANSYEFIEKLKSFPQDKLTNRFFVVDEQKQSVFNIGSTAKKSKISDVQNIIAIQNISTISINPTKWANPDSQYGLRVFGRDFKTKTTRFMLYNLSEHGKGGEIPMGNIYLPIFTQILNKEDSEKLEKDYLKKKNEWVLNEQKGFGDVLYEIKMKSARSFMRDKNYLSLKKRGEKETYISVKLGSEWTKGEVLEIYEITKLLEQGVLTEKDL